MIRNIIKVKLILALIVFHSSSIYADGMGIISKADFKNASEMINFPAGDNYVFDKPNGQNIGFINKSTEYKNYIFNAIRLEIGDSIGQIMDRADFKEINYEGGCFKYYEEKDGFVRILKYTYDFEVWISIDSLKTKEYFPLSWPEFMLLKKEFLITSINEPIQLKSNPDSVSQTIIKLDSNRFLITITGEQKGNWFKVIVKEYSKHYMEVKSESPKLHEGWIEALDKKGHPSIWYYTRGC